MRKIWVLLRVLLKSSGTMTSKKKGRQWWLWLLLGFAFLSLAFSVGMMAFGFYEVTAQVGAQGMLVPLALGATSMIIFIFGVFYTISVMYHADDIPLLLALPLRPYQMLGAKFLTLVIYEYIFELFILLPVLVVYGILSGAGAAYVLYSVILFAVLPVIPLAMASVLVMIVMRFTSFGKNKQAFKFVGGIIAMVLAIGLNVALSSVSSNLTPEQLQALAYDMSALTGVMEGIFPGTGFGSQALQHSAGLSGLFNLLLFGLCSAAAAAVFLLLGQWLYFKGLSGVSEAAGRRRALSVEELGKSTAGASAVWSYVGKEIRLLMRSPVAFMNCVAIVFIWPVLVLVSILSGGESSIMKLGEVIGTINPGILVALLAGLTAFFASGNGITSTAISREGRFMYFMKYIPLPMEKQLYAKLYAGMLLSGIGVVEVVVLAAVLGMGVTEIVLGLVLSVPTLAAGSLIGLLIDVARPKLNWVNEQQAIKQNTNYVLHMLAGLVLAAVIVLPVLIANMPLVWACVYILLVSGIPALLMWRSLARGAVRRLTAMDA